MQKFIYYRKKKVEFFTFLFLFFG
ncbi:sugar ABC transporter permease, partial [Enterococcus faecium]|nr:sugar ABC transporter permease [Enterococcus faecium]